MTFQNSYSRSGGFTLIELIMVIVILGILSAFALPKFADFSSDAEDSSIDGARGAVRSAAAITHAACLASSNCNASGATSSVDVEGTAIAMVYGYPSAAGIISAASLDGYSINTTAAPAVVALSDDSGAKCFSYTIAADASTPPVISAMGTLSHGADAAFGGTDDTCP